MSLTDLSFGFRDESQRRRVQAVVHDRLADDRDQQECRCLMRFWWQLSMRYSEVTAEQLAANVSRAKLDTIEALIQAIRTSHAAIDAWVTDAERAFGLIDDRGFWAALERDF
ncbi:hypothetical protein [Actinacidiphila rubida]|uniref:hypothetical protein n=1 Tax=Actinacidiphila rubida TaxID=310780 RepID=UPI00114D19FE|nr:hypothetical protein [Actinacidiphila rubida]